MECCRLGADKGMLLISFSRNRMLLIRSKEKIRLQIRRSGI